MGSCPAKRRLRGLGAVVIGHCWLDWEICSTWSFPCPPFACPPSFRPEVPRGFAMDFKCWKQVSGSPVPMIPLTNWSIKST